LGGHGKRILQFPGEIDILDQDTLHFNTPSHCDIRDDFLDTLRDFLSSFNDVLQDSGTKDMTQRGLCTLHKRRSDVSDSKSGLVRIDNVEINDRGNVDVYIILCHAHLRRNLDDCDFDVDLLNFLAQSTLGGSEMGIRIDSCQTWIDGAMVFAELQDETSLSFIDYGLAGV
jgi:hypothetical protein